MSGWEPCGERGPGVPLPGRGDACGRAFGVEVEEAPGSAVAAVRGLRRLARYGEALRAATPRGSELPGLVHLHHNRLLGIDPEAEDHARSVARGAMEAQRGRRLRRPRVHGRTG
ncbi:hypothetical protein [Kitasatospora sp. NPDC098663]|uniref:hypothetical protein n=1 Tax=Kitasatospora sp. NPDC098663 TaxID=3364096 RepID=UPI003825CD41